MPTVLNEYEGDGVSRSFNVAMEGGYLSRDYVKFYVRPLEAMLDWSPLDNNTVTWTGEFSFTLADAIPTGTVLVVFRETPLTPLVDFQNTSRITEKNLDTGVTQPLHKVAELTDLVDRSTYIAGEAIVAATAARDAAEVSAASAVASAESAAGALAVSAEARDVAEEASQTANTALELVEEAVSGAVVSFNGRQGEVMPAAGDYNKSMVGLSEVDNTSDAAKPISLDTQAALDTKADTVAVNIALASKADTAAVNTAISAKADTVDVNLALAAKADTVAVVDALSTKADVDVVLTKTSPTGAAILPEGDNAQRPPTGSIPAGVLFMRGNTQDPAVYKAEYWDRVAGGWEAFASRTWVGQQVTAAVNAVKDWVNQQIGFAIIYPNGGTAAAPANVSINTLYASASPFPGHHVICEAEVLLGGEWTGSGWYSSQTAAVGVAAQQKGDSIYLQTGATGLVPRSNLGGNAFGISAADVATPLPCRVLVRKVKGAAV